MTGLAATYAAHEHTLTMSGMWAPRHSPNALLARALGMLSSEGSITTRVRIPLRSRSTSHAAPSSRARSHCSWLGVPLRTKRVKPPSNSVRSTRKVTLLPETPKFREAISFPGCQAVTVEGAPSAHSNTASLCFRFASRSTPHWPTRGRSCRAAAEKRPFEASGALYFGFPAADDDPLGIRLPNMSSREHPRPPLESPTEAFTRSQTGSRRVEHGASQSGFPPASGRSGEYPAIGAEVRPPSRMPSDMGSEDRLTPSEPISTAGQPLPALRRPFASLSQIPRPEMPSHPSLLPSEPPPASAPPSIRRPLLAGPQRKLGNCQLHKVALNPQGQCVLCKREHDALVRSRWSLGAVILIVAIAILSGLILAR